MKRLRSLPSCAHSEKENNAGTYKGGYGFAPMVVSIDYCKENGTGEILAAMLRPGNKGANSAKDHITVLAEAMAQLPYAMHDEHGNPDTERILVRTDSAGASREFLHHPHSLGLQFSTSFALPVPNERFIHWINNKDHWEPALDQQGNLRHDAWVIDATKVIELKDYPEGTRLYLRAEPLHPGAKASLFDVDGHRVTAFLNNAPRLCASAKVWADSARRVSQVGCSFPAKRALSVSPPQQRLEIADQRSPSATTTNGSRRTFRPAPGGLELHFSPRG